MPTLTGRRGRRRPQLDVLLAGSPVTALADAPSGSVDSTDAVVRRAGPRARLVQPSSHTHIQPKGGTVSSDEQARRLERLKRIEERFTEEISEPQVREDRFCSEQLVKLMRDASIEEDD